MGKEMEAIRNIRGYIDLTLEESDLKRKDILKHFDNCPLCNAVIIKCPFCSSETPLAYNCPSCKKVLPLKTLLEQLARKLSEI